MKKKTKFLLSLIMLISLATAQARVLASCCDCGCDCCGYDDCGCCDGCDCGEDCGQEGDYYAIRQDSWNGHNFEIDYWTCSDEMQDYIPEGATIREEGGIDVYIVKYSGGKMFKRLVLNPEVFDNYQHLRWEDVITVSPDVVDAFITSDLVRSDVTGKIYRLYPAGDRGTKRLVEYHGCFWNQIDWDSVYTINQFDERSYTTSSSLE